MVFYSTNTTTIRLPFFGILATTILWLTIDTQHHRYFIVSRSFLLLLLWEEWYIFFWLSQSVPVNISLLLERRESFFFQFIPSPQINKHVTKVPFANNVHGVLAPNGNLQRRAQPAFFVYLMCETAGVLESKANEKTSVIGETTMGHPRCLICNKTFNLKIHLVVHLRTIHGSEVNGQKACTVLPKRNQRAAATLATSSSPTSSSAISQEEISGQNTNNKDSVERNQVNNRTRSSMGYVSFVFNLFSTVNRRVMTLIILSHIIKPQPHTGEIY